MLARSAPDSESNSRVPAPRSFERHAAAALFATDPDRATTLQRWETLGAQDDMAVLDTASD